MRFVELIDEFEEGAVCSASLAGDLHRIEQPESQIHQRALSLGLGLALALACGVCRCRCRCRSRSRRRRRSGIAVSVAVDRGRSSCGRSRSRSRSRSHSRSGGRREEKRRLFCRRLRRGRSVLALGDSLFDRTCPCGSRSRSRLSVLGILQEVSEVRAVSGKPTWQAGRLAGWQAGRLAGWQAGRLAGWQAGRLAGVLTHQM